MSMEEDMNCMRRSKKKQKTRQQFVAAEGELNLDATNERQKQININNN